MSRMTMSKKYFFFILNVGPIENWGAFRPSGGCSRTCGSGVQRLIRSCIGGSNCNGSDLLEIPCNQEMCPGKVGFISNVVTKRVNAEHLRSINLTLLIIPTAIV